MNIYDFYITPEEYEIAQRNGISRKTLEYRIKEAYWDEEKAISIKPKVKKKIPKEIIELAKKNGICYRTLLSRIKKLGDMEKAATDPVIDGRENILKANKKRVKYSRELIQLANSNGISTKCFYQRVKRDRWDLEKAATTPVMTSSEIGKMTKDKSKRVFDIIFQNKNKKQIRNMQIR